jgi:hypothetical protein
MRLDIKTEKMAGRQLYCDNNFWRGLICLMFASCLFLA